MVWAQAAMTVVGMIGGAQTARIQYKASMKQAEEQTKQSKAKQEELNAHSELQRAIQKINNERILKAGDKNFGTMAQSLERMRSQRTVSRVMRETAQAEAMGAYIANTASKNIGGGSADVISHTMELRDALQNELHDRADAQADYDAVQTLAGIIPSAWQQQDMTVISGNSSAAAAVPAVTGGFNYASALANSGLMSGLADLFSSTPSAAPAEGGYSGSGLTLPGSAPGLGTKPSGFWAPSTALL